MLDSDVTPDSRLAVRFYSHEMINHYQSNIDGRPISYMAYFVRIEVPGDRNTIIDTFVNEDHKRRFPLQWAQYLNEKTEGKISDDVQGTLLRDWQGAGRLVSRQYPKRSGANWCVWMGAKFTRWASRSDGLRY